jgi:hypothetical protein
MCERDAVNRTRNAEHDRTLGTLNSVRVPGRTDRALALIYPFARAAIRQSMVRTRTRHSDLNETRTHDSQATVGTNTKWKVYLQTRGHIAGVLGVVSGATATKLGKVAQANVAMIGFSPAHNRPETSIPSSNW